MLSDVIKDEIQNAYRQILTQKSLRARAGQRVMIAEIAKALSAIETGGPDIDKDSSAEKEAAPESPPNAPIIVIEAGTGTGKTLAYVLGTLPLARHLGKKVVLATATVALQEQVSLRDLPDILQHSGLSFSYVLAKGRGRYLCLSRLDQLLRGNASQDAMLELFGEFLDSPNDSNQTLYEDMLEKISAGQWQGDRDDWQGIVSDRDWAPVTVESGQCAGQKCSNYSRCFFYKAREQVQKVDCVIANHDLVLVDLALGGGVILPDPQNTIYIFDEAHHLPGKTNQHFSSSTRLRSTLAWLDASARTLKKLMADSRLQDNGVIARECADLDTLIRATSEALGHVLMMLEPMYSDHQQKLGEPKANESRQQDGQDTMTFALGVIPESLQEQSRQLGSRFTVLGRSLREITVVLKRQMEEADTLPARQQAELWFPVIGGMVSRSDSNEKLWQAFARPDNPGDAPAARWLSAINAGMSTGSPGSYRKDVSSSQQDPIDFQLSCSPVLAAQTLIEHLWQRCAGAVLTSATLSALGTFDVLAMRAGLPAQTVYHRISSPFDYANAATLIIPKLNCDPADTRAHTAAIVSLLPKVLNLNEASLMLFSSRRQMLDVLDSLSADLRSVILCQDDYQKAQLLTLHRQRVDANEPSIIFGLASFAEGVDLPGRYCEHVLIAKIPFSVPNDPIEATLAQWIEQQGRNAFTTLSVPEASFKLVQAAGRLLRSETDSGRITVFDERLVSKFYGKSILASLPPFTREIFPRWLSLPGADNSAS
ncbi:ATP-dependent DNA helicase DinG [Gammaproteobacteria bacterium LSUCC0112]|nr:ATP-dependent DNA helicase DinG [Gammaproteobacteria bacterium LSUCC0112]